MTTEAKLIQKLDAIREEISFIKDHMIDIDSIMTEDDYQALQEYRKQKKSKKLTSHEQLKREIISNRNS